MSNCTLVPIKNSIATRLLIAVFSVYFFIALTVTFVHMWAEYQNAKGGILNELKALKVAFEDSLSTAVWDINKKQLESITHGMRRISVIRGIHIVDANNKVLIMTDNNLSTNEGEVVLISDKDESSNFSLLAASTFGYQFPLMYFDNNQKREVGTAIFYSDRGIVFEKVKNGFMFIIINSIIKTMALWFIFLWFSKRILIRPLTELNKATQNIQLENLDQMQVHVFTQGEDELKSLENSFNAMIKNLLHSRLALNAALKELSRANSHLQILLSGVRKLASTRDKYHAQVQTLNSIFEAFPNSIGHSIKMYFQDTFGHEQEGFTVFAFKVEQSAGKPPILKNDAVDSIHVSFSKSNPCRFQNELEQMHGNVSLQVGRTLVIPLQRGALNLGGLEIDLKQDVKLGQEDKNFIDTLAQSLSITLESVDFTMGLEKIIRERTLKLKEALSLQQEISDDLIKSSTELKESRGQLEQQNLSLQTSVRRLEDLVITKELLLSRIHLVQSKHFKVILEQLHLISLDKTFAMREEIRSIAREAHHINELLRPLDSIYQTEKAIQSKHVLLAETNRKLQIIGKMALGGTGMILDLASNTQEGLELLKSKNYDVLCVNSTTMSLAEHLQRSSPQTKILFMTTDNAKDYIPLLQKHTFLTNIVSGDENDRTMTMKSILTTVSKLVNNDIFGMEKYLNWGVEVQEAKITHSAERNALIEGMEKYLLQLGVRKTIIGKCTSVAEELLMNAIYDAPHDAQGNSLYNHLSRTVPVSLLEQQQGVFRYACDGLCCAVSAEDPFGAFDRATLLNYLITNINGNSTQLHDKLNKGGAGKGVYQMFCNADLLVVNVKPQLRTEVIALFILDFEHMNKDVMNSFHYFLA